MLCFPLPDGLDMLDTKLESRTFLLLLAVVTLAFGWLLLPFYGAVFWGTILAIIFAPVQRRLQVRLRDRKNLAALITLLICVLIVIIPVIFIAGSLVQEGASVYQRVKSGELNFAAYLQQAVAALPPSVHQWLERFDLANLSSLQEKLSSVAMQASQVVATKAFSIGQNTLDFVISFGIMLYLLFFLLRDGRVLGRRIKQAVPLSQEHKHHLFAKFTTVIRATVKGNIAVAATQGALGGLIFWVLGIEGALLWGTLMAFLSLLPAIGAALIWRRWRPISCSPGRSGGRSADPVLRGGDRPGGQHPAPDPGRQGHQDAGLRGADLHPRRHGLVRPQRLRHRPADRRAVHGQLGPVHWSRGRTTGLSRARGDKPRECGLVRFRP